MEPRVSTPFSSGVYQVPWERVATLLATRSVILAGIFTCPRSLYTRTISPSWMATGGGIFRVDPEFLWVQSAKPQVIVMDRMGAAFAVPAG